ncbi:MAG: serine hydrolase [Acidobacteriota bacterium]
MASLYLFIGAGAATSESLSPSAPAPQLLDCPLSPEDPDLQDGLRRVVARLGLMEDAARGRLGIALVDLSRSGQMRAATINGDQMFYAASLPKIAIMLAAFEASAQGQIKLTPRRYRRVAQMIRSSDNAAATAVLDRVGFAKVASTLQADAYRLYEPRLGGGLWVGKAYAEDRYWHRDPMAGLSHAATPRQAARFFVLLDQGKLVSEVASAEMKRLLADSEIHHKFVRGLDKRPGASIYRKSGTWHDFHADAALVVRPDARYVAVGLVESRHGEEILQRLIVALDDLVCG